MTRPSSPERLALVQPMWKLRADSRDLIADPPPGYRFYAREGYAENVVRGAASFDASFRALHAAQRLLPVNLVRAALESKRPVRPGTDLVYGVLTPVFRSLPWFTDMQAEVPYLLAGRERVFERWKALVRRAYRSPWFRGAIFGVEAGRQAFLNALEWPDGEPKTRVIYPAVGVQPVVERSMDRPVRLLFVNSANITATSHFYGRGGPVLLEAFRILRQDYPDLELTIRSALPKAHFEQWSGFPGLRILEDVLPWPAMADEFRSADIFVCPAHQTPYMVFPDAMSFGLPVVTTDVWANCELVDDRRTGLIIHHPTSHEYIDSRGVHRFDAPAWRRTSESVQPDLLRQLVSSLRVLIENPTLRRQLGENARREVAEGRFSIERRKELLSQALDGALRVGTEVPSK